MTDKERIEELKKRNNELEYENATLLQQLENYRDLRNVLQRIVKEDDE